MPRHHNESAGLKNGQGFNLAVLLGAESLSNGATSAERLLHELLDEHALLVGESYEATAEAAWRA